MPALIEVKIENLDKLIALANKFPRITQKHIDLAIAESLGDIQTEVQPIVPRKSTRLWDELQVPKLKPFQGSIGSKLPYARKVHDMYSEGTSYKFPSLNKSAVAGFLSLGVKRAMKSIQNNFKEAMEKILKEVTK